MVAVWEKGLVAFSAANTEGGPRPGPELNRNAVALLAWGLRWNH